LSKEAFELVMAQSNPCHYLTKETSLGQLYNLYSTMTKVSRYGRKDWQRVLDKIPEGCQKELSARVDEAKQWKVEQEEQAKKESEARWERYRQEQAETEEAQKREDITLKEQIVYNADLMLGALQSETSEVFRRRERDNLDTGDLLDDPVSSRLRSGGWADEYNQRAGFKLQISVSLDVSNSNWYNKVAEPAIRAFQELVLTVRNLHEEHPNDVVYSAWLFAKNRDGKGVERLHDYTKEWDYSNGQHKQVLKPIEDPLKETFRLFKAHERIPHWAGEDSWLSPLLRELHYWEDNEVGAGFVKLDIILSDGVFERKVDIQEADNIQTQRGQCHTVVLNFIDEDEWYAGRMPFQTVQYPVTKDNISGLLRLVLASFLEVYI
jgi:hypothetical protein